MTDKQVIIDCKYKFQDNEKFNGKPYCTLHNELCEDLSFACDTNCQIYEDYKQLKRLELKLKLTEADYEASEQECEELKKANIHIDNNRMVKSNKLKKIEEYCRKQNLKADYTAYEILQIIEDVK